MLIDSGVGKEQIKKSWTLDQLEGVLALVRKERADVNSKVMLVGQRCEQ